MNLSLLILSERATRRNLLVMRVDRECDTDIDGHSFACIPDIENFRDIRMKAKTRGIETILEILASWKIRDMVELRMDVYAYQSDLNYYLKAT